ncbi:Protein CBG24904 [Caenorhabditis briggsae]|uniref:Protein CBG24904 n=1 Tax=Caenorhabditis briggsae TaxID=6238 RepID=A8WLR0_CAEBR|nr:Protein CBG24904 [Caenorhabditis briggsae]CAP21406.2 Protein CBG24904 [Caenorhabditis briggsae]
MNSSNGETLLRHFNPYLENEFKYYLIFFIVSGIIVLSIFAIYLNVYKLNKSRDQETAVFQIIDHFHEINKKLTMAFWCFVAFEYLLYYLDYLTLFYLFLIFSALPFACVSEVNQFLIGLLAIQRFFVYFYPSTEKYLNFSRRTVNWILVVAYACSISEGIFLLKTSSEKEPNLSISAMEDNYSVLSYFFLFYALYGVLDNEDKPFLRISAAIECSKIFDALLMPTITQITYLGCNRRNVMALWKTVKPKWFFKSSRRIDSDVRVQYGQRVETTL